jgi:hypothetical protein
MSENSRLATQDSELPAHSMIDLALEGSWLARLSSFEGTGLRFAEGPVAQLVRAHA